jgi:hypothetical protein
MQPTHTKPRSRAAPVIRLHITAKDAAGNVIAHQIKENDIFLWNWAVLIAQFLKLQFAPSDATTYGYKNTAGTAKTTAAPSMYGISYTVDWKSSWRIQIGSGSNAPAITDYCLQSFVKEVQPTIPDIVIPQSGNVLKLVFSSTFTFTAETVCAETAIKASGCLENSIAATADYLLTRDTFTPVTVPAGGTITLQHELLFNGTA